MERTCREEQPWACRRAHPDRVLDLSRAAMAALPGVTEGSITDGNTDIINVDRIEAVPPDTSLGPWTGKWNASTSALLHISDDRFGFVTGLPTLCRAQETSSIASEVARIRSGNVQMILSNSSDPKSERLIVWDTGSGDRQAAHIALCTAAGRCLWQHTWPSSYSATIQYMGPWSTDRDFMFLVTCNRGAEARTAAVIGLRKGQAPRLLAQEDEAWIAIAPQVSGLEVNTSSGLPATMKCLCQDVSSLKFSDVACC